MNTYEASNIVASKAKKAEIYSYSCIQQNDWKQLLITTQTKETDEKEDGVLPCPRNFPFPLCFRLRNEQFKIMSYHRFFSPQTKAQSFIVGNWKQ